MSTVLRSAGRRLAAVFTATLLFFSGSAVAFAQHDGGHEGAEGLSCADLIPGASTLTISPGAFNSEIVESDGTIQVRLSPFESDLGPMFDWSASQGVDAIIVAGGPKVMAWEYEPAATAGSSLHAPLNMEGSHFHKPKTISVCYRVEVADVALAVTKSDSADPVKVGDQFDYQITVSNTGGEDFTAVTLDDPVPSLVEVTGVEGCPDWDGSSSVICSLGPLGPESTATVVVTVEAVEAGVAVNKAVATATTGTGSTLTATASEATVIEKRHEDDGDDHDHIGPSCEAFGPDMVAIGAGEEALHSSSAVVSDETVSVTLSLYEGAMGTLFDWASNYPLSGVLTVGGSETLSFPYPPLTFAGSGLHAPLSGGETHYRGLRQATFCYQPGPFVDVAVDMVADEARVLVGDSVVYTITVSNLGVAGAESVTLDVDSPASLAIDWDSTTRSIGLVPAGEEVEIQLIGEALATDPAAVMGVEVSASNEDAGVEGNNASQTSVEILATTPVTVAPGPESPDTGASSTTSSTTPPEVLGASTTTTVAPTSLDTLPFTGGPMQSLAILALISIASGLVLLRWARPEWREVDLVLYREGEEHLIPW